MYRIEFKTAAGEVLFVRELPDGGYDFTDDQDSAALYDTPEAADYPHKSIPDWVYVSHKGSSALVKI